MMIARNARVKSIVQRRRKTIIRKLRHILLEEVITLIKKKLDNTSIYYWINDSDAETSILFLHPAFADHSCFDKQMKYFGNHFKVIALDLIGHGCSLGKGSITDTADNIAAIMKTEKIGKINLVGVSIGAVLVADFANQYPDQLASLCCIGGYDINHFKPELQKGNSSQQMKMMLRGFLSIRKFAEENKKISAYTPEAQEQFYNMNLHFKKSSFRYLAPLGSLINKHETQERSYPLLIGVGEHDNEMAIKASKQWAESEPTARFVIFSGAGHIVNMDTPDAFNKELESLLQ